MHDLSITISKLEEQVELSERAESRFEKAAIFAATSALARRFAEEGKGSPNSFEMNSSFLRAVDDACVFIYAAIGYGELRSGNNAGDHLLAAKLRIEEMRRMWHKCRVGPHSADPMASRDCSSIVESEVRTSAPDALGPETPPSPPSPPKTGGLNRRPANR